MHALTLRRRVVTGVWTLAFAMPLCLVAQTSDLGSVVFPNSGADHAQKHFLRGVLLLHSFEYSDAAEAFRQAQQTDPDFALAYWGEALTHSHLLWRSQDVEQGRSILARFDSTRAGRLQRTKTERERAYMSAVEMLYGEGESQLDRRRDYRDAMKEVHDRFPDDLEAAALYAVSILGAVDGGRDHAEYMKAAGVAEQVFAENPMHPGAAHYLIHAYDDPDHVPLGLRPARVYAKIAPAASHALHMPSHVFLAGGLWDDVVASNRASWESSIERMERKNLGVEEKGFHALLWLHYGLTQRGQFEEAERVLVQMKQDAAASRSRRTRHHLASMVAHHIVETQDWNNEEALSTVVDVSDLGVETFAGYHFALGYAAIRRGDLEEGRVRLNRILERLDREDASESVDRRVAGVMASELIAMIDMELGDTETAVETLRDAAHAEEAIPYGYGPPEIVKPSAELLGEALLESGKHGQAREAFTRALKRNQRRVLSQDGLVAALIGMNHEEAASREYQVLSSIRRSADSPVLRWEEYLLRIADRP